MRRAVATWIVGVAALLALAGCGKRSMLATQLDQDLTDVNRAVERGDVEVACAKAPGVMPRLYEWAQNARGGLAARANPLVDQLAQSTMFCSLPPSAQGPAGADFATQWKPAYAELRKISTYKTSWLTVFTYVSMLVVGIVTYVFLRRMKRS